MPKVIIAHELCHVLLQGNSFLGRTDIKIFSVASTDDVFRIHKAEHADLIISDISLPGSNSERVFSSIRQDKALCSVPVIMVCAQNTRAIEQCARCGVSDIVFRPVNPHLLLARAQQFLALFTRESCRVPHRMPVEAVYRNERLACTSLDVGATGMRIESEKPLALGEHLICTFSIAGSPQIVAKAEVVNVLQPPTGAREHRYGIRFKDLPPAVRRTLQAFVDLTSHEAA